MPATFPTTPLFHYSSMPDLKALLASQSLTLAPLDTTTELNAALSFIQGAIVSAYPQLSADYFNLDNIGSYPVFSYSLTGQKDSAALWQNFSPDGGFSFTSSAAQLSAAMDANGLMLVPCLYDDAAKTDFVINNIVAASTDGEPDPQGPMFQKRMALINRNILNYISILKDASRSGEQEWRIIAYYSWANLLMGPTDPPDPLSLPVLNSSTGPYVAAPLVSGSYSTVGIEQIVIGPHADMPRAMADCQALIASYSLPYVVITESGVPYQ